MGLRKNFIIAVAGGAGMGMGRLIASSLMKETCEDRIKIVDSLSSVSVEEAMKSFAPEPFIIHAGNEYDYNISNFCSVPDGSYKGLKDRKKHASNAKPPKKKRKN